MSYCLHLLFTKLTRSLDDEWESKELASVIS